MFTTVSQFEIQRTGSKPHIKNQNENDQSMSQSISQTSTVPYEPINYYQSHTKLENQSNISAQQIGSSHQYQGSNNIIKSPSKITVEPDVQSSNSYQSSSTTVMNQSSFTTKSESSQLIQSQNNQGPSQLLRLPAVSATIRTDALSSSPSAASHLSDSSQSTVVRQLAVNDRCESGQSSVQISKSESRYEKFKF